MAPLFLFLASSLNVELVYIILTSLEKFTYLMSDETVRLSRIIEDLGDHTEIIDDNDNSTLLIKEIAISDPNRWSSSIKMEDYIQNNFVIGGSMSTRKNKSHSHISNESVAPPQINLRSNVKVKFHKKRLFMETF